MSKSKILNVLTLGHLNRKAKKEAKKLSEQKNSELKLNTVALPDVNALTNALGTANNIKNVKNTISTITFEVNDISKVNFNELKNIVKKGVIKSSSSITLLIGDCANALAKYFSK